MFHTLMNRLRHGGDAGVALVAAVAVGLIGVMLTVVVVSQVIVVMNDAARDRVRTSEIHSAEGALDAALKELEAGQPCKPSFSPIVVGGGASAVEVTVTTLYYEDLTLLDECVDGAIVGTPNRAVITARAIPLNPAPGIAPVRSIESVVRLTPRQGISFGASIFAGDSLNGVNSGTIVPTDPDYPAGLWIDSGNFECSNSFRIDGDLIVPAGGIRLANTCSVTGDAWARDFFQSEQSPPSWRVGGDLTVRNGPLTVAQRTSFGGNLIIGGNISGAGFAGSTVAGSVCSNNIGTPCTSFTEYEPRGFPRVDWDPGEWDGFVPKTEAQWADDVVNGWSLTAAREATFRDNPCRLSGNLSNAPIKLSSTASVYNLTGCDFGTQNTVTLELFSDTAIFARDFETVNQFHIVSGNGNSYEIWFIVPSGGAPGTPASTDCYNGYCPGNIALSNQTAVLQPISIFLYTPGTITIGNNQTLSGQIYGKNINITNGFELRYVPMGIPGVELGALESSAAMGFIVEVVNKRELRE